MRTLYSVLFFCFFGISNAIGQISVTATAATTGPTTYTTLKGAFDAINAGTHKGVITVNINGNTTELLTAVLQASSGASSYTAININATTNAVISSNLFGSTISFNGADNVNLNGNNQLEIINTSTGGRVFFFENDATNNTLRNTTFKGAVNLPTITAGMIHFGPGNANGNDNNTIDNCLLDGGNTANCLIYSSAPSSTDNNIFNSGNTVKNSRFQNFINPSVAAAAGIFLERSTNWTIENNSFYFTTPLNINAQFIFRGILATPAFTNDFHTVTGNFVGGNAPSAAGTATLTASGTNVLGMIGIDVETGGAGNVVSNNSVKNINITYSSSSGSYTNSGIFAFIGGFNGATTLTGNTVNNISFTNGNGFLQFNAIHVNGRVTTNGATVKPDFTITNNTVSGITMGSGGSTGDIALMGIRLETSSSGSLASGTSNPLFTVTGNTISNLSSNFTGVAASYIRGIATSTAQGASSTTLLFPKVNISNNTIHTLNNASGVGNFTSPSTYANYGTPVVVGISYGGSTGAAVNTTDTMRINGNTVYNLNATNTSNNGVVATGILASVGILEVTKNKVYGLKNGASGAGFSPAPGIIGINIRRTDGTANSIVANNFVSLGSNEPSNVQIFGILNNFAGGTGPLQVFHNSIVVTGAGPAGNDKVTSAFQRGTENQGTGVTTPIDLRNNILYNSRTGGGSHYAVSNTSATPATGFTSDYNDLYTVNPVSVALWGTTTMDLASYKTASGDANSRTAAVTFLDVVNGDLHLTGASVSDADLKAVPVPNVAVDYDNDARSATAPTMGADEGTTACVAPAITTQPAAQQACTSGNATFSVTVTGTSLTYQWRKGGVDIVGATASTYSVTGATASDFANYDVVISNGCGSVTSAAVSLTMKAATNISSQPADQAVCAGGNASFSVTATGEGTVTYQWRKNGANIASATASALSITGATAADAGSYDVVVTAECGSVTSSAATLTINAAPAITTQPADQTACTGSAATFSVVATGAGLTYQWQKNGNSISGATNASYTIASAAASDAATYTVVVSGTCSPSVTSAAATLTLGGAPVINTQPASQTVCTGSAATFTVAATGSGLTYQWRKGGTNIAGANNATYTIASATAADAASYDVVVTTSCATTATSNAATLTVNEPTAISTQPSAQTVCAGAAASFTVSATGTNLTYQWRKGGTNIAGATSAAYSIASTTAASAGTYDVVVTGTCGAAVTSSQVALTVNAVTAIGTQPAAQTVCAGSPANFTVAATGTNLTYQWRKGGVNIAGATSAAYSIPAVVAADAANYDVVVTGTCGSVTSTAVALALQTTGCTTSLPVIDTDVESAVLMPNLATSMTTLKLQVKRSMQISWVITDVNGRVVRTFNSQASPGSNDLRMYVQELSAGMYYLNGRNSKGHVASLKFVKQ